MVRTIDTPNWARIEKIDPRATEGLGEAFGAVLGAQKAKARQDLLAKRRREAFEAVGAAETPEARAQARTKLAALGALAPKEALELQEGQSQLVERSIRGMKMGQETKDLAYAQGNKEELDKANAILTAAQRVAATPEDPLPKRPGDGSRRAFIRQVEAARLKKMGVDIDASGMALTDPDWVGNAQQQVTALGAELKSEEDVMRRAVANAGAQYPKLGGNARLLRQVEDFDQIYANAKAELQSEGRDRATRVSQTQNVSGDKTDLGKEATNKLQADAIMLQRTIPQLKALQDADPELFTYVSQGRQAVARVLSKAGVAPKSESEFLQARQDLKTAAQQVSSLILYTNAGKQLAEAERAWALDVLPASIDENMSVEEFKASAARIANIQQTVVDATFDMLEAGKLDRTPLVRPPRTPGTLPTGAAATEQGIIPQTLKAVGEGGDVFKSTVDDISFLLQTGELPPEAKKKLQSMRDRLGKQYFPEGQTSE